MSKRLIVIIGPTAVGKTAVSVWLAKTLGCEILSCDSRQFYKELSIGTAKPTPEEMQGVPHHFIDSLSITDEYSAGKFEQDALVVLNRLFEASNTALMVGGSGLYVDAVCRGVDDLPEANPKLRDQLNNTPLMELQQRLQAIDPNYAEVVDKQNAHRIIRAIEVFEVTGTPYSALRQQQPKARPFDVVKIGLELPREQLYERINQRAELMMKSGLLEEAKALHPNKDLQALQTVGYRELFRHLDGELTLEQAVEEIKKNTRRYAKRQLTYWRRDEDIKWLGPDDHDEIVGLVCSTLD